MLSPKPNIKNLAPFEHGGVNYLEMDKLGISPKNVLDFSVSTNPFGPPPGLREALREASIDSYPDYNSTKLKEVLAIKLRISPENLLIGNGSTELIRLVAMAYLGTGDRVLIFQPTYSEYETACRLSGCTILKRKALEKNNFSFSIPEVKNAIRKHKPQGIFLCNPNNPTGQYLSREDIEQILKFASDSLVVLDEAYISFTENTWSSLTLINHNNLVILRSLTKDFALAGLRLGYAVAAGPIITVLKRIKPPWNVNSFAQEAGIYVLNNGGYLETCQTKIKESQEFLIENFQRLGLKPLPSQANFFLVKVVNAVKIRQILLQKGIVVRDCASFGLPAYIRLSTRTMPECQRLVTALREIEINRYNR